MSLLISITLGGLVLGFVSAGVVRARTLRLALAWVVLTLGALVELVAVLSVDDLPRATVASFSFATSVVALAALWSFRRTGWYAWQRTKPPTGQGAPIGRLVAIGVLVGVLGGLAGPVEDGVDVRITVADR